MQVQVYIADSGQLLRPTHSQLNINGRLSDWMRQVELLGGIPERSQIWMTSDGFAISTIDPTTPLIHSLATSASFNFNSPTDFQFIFFVYDRQLFLSTSGDIPMLEPRIPRDLQADIKQRISVHQKAIQAAHDNLSQHIASIQDNHGKIVAHTTKTVQNFQLLLKSFESDMLIVKSIPIHPSISGFEKAPTRQGPPFLSDYINEDLLRQTVSSSSAHIKSHEKAMDDFQKQIQEIHNTARDFEQDISDPFEFNETSDNVTSTYKTSRNLFISRLKRISEMQSMLVNLSNDLNKLSSSLTALNQCYRPLLSAHRLPVAYGTALVELVRRKEYHKIILKRVRDVSDLFADIAEMENTRRKSFYSQVGIYIPEGLIPGLENPPGVVEINLRDKSSEKELPGITKNDLKTFLKDVQRIRSNLDAEKSVHSLHKLQAILTDMIPQLDNVDSAIDKKILACRLVERSLRHQQNPQAVNAQSSAIFNAPIGTEQPAREIPIGSIMIGRRRSSASTNPQSLPSSSFPPNEQIQSYQSRIQSLEKLLREKYHQDEQQTLESEHQTRIRELEATVESQEADIKRLNKDLDLLIEELRHKNNSNGSLNKEPEIDLALIETLIGPDQQWNSFNDVLALIKGKEREQELATQSFVLEMVKFFNEDLAREHERTIKEALKKNNVETMRDLIDSFKSLELVKASQELDLTSVSSSFKPSSALTSMLRKHVSSEEHQIQHSRSRTLSESSVETSISRKSSLLMPSKSNPTTAITTTVSPFSSALDLPDLPADIAPIEDLKSSTIKRKRKKFLPFASSPQSWFF